MHAFLKGMLPFLKEGGVLLLEIAANELNSGIYATHMDLVRELQVDAPKGVVLINFIRPSTSSKCI